MSDDRAAPHPAAPALSLAPGCEVPDEDVWVFAYGSLMWQPGFPYQESRRALLRGYHRSLCILSIRNRGSRERPGLALGLDRGGSCQGWAFRVAAGCWPRAVEDLWRREMATAVYTPRCLPIRLAGGARLSALAFVARPEHAQYAGGLSEDEAAALVAQGRGTFGTALDYLRNVVRHLDEFGIVDCPLHRILAHAEALHSSVSPAGGERTIRA